MAKKILVYTFNKPDQISYKFCKSLPDDKFDKCYLGSLSDLGKEILTKEYDYIFGFGNNSDSSKIEIEVLYTNKYGKLAIDSKGNKFLRSNLLLNNIDKSKILNRVFGGFCNRAAYFIANIIKLNKLQSQAVFIHVPSKFSLKMVKTEVNLLLKKTTC